MNENTFILVFRVFDIDNLFSHHVDSNITAVNSPTDCSK
jgi:hypothetical protein